MNETPGGAAAAFDRDATAYDAARRRLIPCFDDFYGAAIGQLPFDGCDEPRILDLGAGTGLLSAAIRKAIPGCRLTLIDAAPAMIDLARQRFAGDDRIVFAVADYGETLPEGPFEAVVSALSIHHLDNAGKQRLLTAIHECLVPGGVFVNADQVLAANAERAVKDREQWCADCLQAGASLDDLAQAAERMRHDILAPLVDQTTWLAGAGFVEVDIAFKNGWFAVYGGRKPYR